MEKKVDYHNANKRGWFKKPLPRVYIDKLLEVPGRDGLLLAAMVYTAFRPNEIQSLTWEDVIDNRGRALKSVKIISSKQSKLQGRMVTHEVPILPDFAQRLETYYRDQGEPPLSFYLFYRRKGANPRVPLATRSMERIVKSWAYKKRIPNSQDLSPYSIRKSVISMFADENGLEAAQFLTGHKSQATLLAYLGHNQETVDSGFAKLFGKTEISLYKMIEEGMVDVNVAALIHNQSPSQWSKLVIRALDSYSSNESEKATVARIWLAPFRSELFAKSNRV